MLVPQSDLPTKNNHEVSLRIDLDVDSLDYSNFFILNVQDYIDEDEREVQVKSESKLIEISKETKEERERNT